MIGICAVFMLAGASCANDTTDSAAEQAATTVVESSDSTTTEVEPSEQVAAPADWEEHVVDPETGCLCADGSDFSFWSRKANPEKVMLYFQGGGACFTEETCSFEDGSYTVTAEVDGTPGGGKGIFDVDNPDNPLADWSIVYVPYCTGDVHIGNNVQTYSDDLTVNHVGFLNASKGLDYVIENFPDASEVFVAGSSAGGGPPPLFGGLVSDELPATKVSVLADASGAYPDNPPINEAIGTLWGTFKNIPNWPENEGLEPKDWSIPGLFTQAGLHDPDIAMARFDNAYDETQQEFSELASLSDGDLKDIIVFNEGMIEASGVPIASYLAPGDAHTILGRPSVYTTEVEGVRFIDWLSDFITGEDVPDVACVDCE